MSRSEAFQFRLPQQDLPALSFCKASAEGMRTWIDSLPRANLGQSTRALYEAINELVRWKATPQQRFELLEALRPAIHSACEGLSRHYLQQPVVLPEQPRKVADLAQAMQRQLLRAYALVAAQCIEKMKSFLGKPTVLMNTAIHRALAECAQVLIRCAQLYQAAPTHLWEEIHALLRLAEQHKMAATEMRDGEASSSVATLYAKLLLLGGIKANQLRQEDVPVIWAALDQWVTLVHFYPVDRGEDKLLIVDPHTDNPLVYRKFYKGDFNADVRQIDTASLVAQLKMQADPTLSGEGPVSRNLLNHLIVAWGILTDRTFMRLEANDKLALCIGLSTTHFFVSGEMGFDALVRGDGSKEPAKALFMVDDGAVGVQKKVVDDSDAKLAQPLSGRPAPVADVWDSAVDADPRQARVSLESIDYHVRKGGRSQMTASGNDREKYQNFEVQTVNMSPGGYCLEWPDQVPLQLKNGEIIGIREAHHAAWSVGAIRWVKQEPNVVPLHLGVELLSPTAIPYGARVLQKRGEAPSDFMRVLALPEIKALGQPMTLITPAVSFREGQKVALIQRGMESTVLLTRLVAQTAGYSQFEFQLSKRIGESPTRQDAPAGAAEEGFDSLWNKL